MSNVSELKPLLKRLKLGAMLDTLPERLTLARRDQLDQGRPLGLHQRDGRDTQGRQRRLEGRIGRRSGFMRAT